MRALVVMLTAALLGSAPALADCPKPYTGAEMTADLGAASTTLRDRDIPAFTAAGKRLEAGLVCADKAFPKLAYASAYRFIGVTHAYNGDEPGARRWFRSALELESTFDWDVDEMDFADPLRATFEAERGGAESKPVAFPGAAFLSAEGTSWLLDGRPLATPAATVERPHVLQQVRDADQSVVQAFLVEGNAFPTAILTTPPTPVVTQNSKGKKGKGSAPVASAATPADDSSYTVTKIQRVRPPAKTPLIVLGGIGVAGGGALYALSYLKHQDFEAATTTEELLAAQKQTNLFVIAAGSVFALGLGTGYVGVTLDSGPGCFVGARF